jgi:hypothetical protein
MRQPWPKTTFPVCEWQRWREAEVDSKDSEDDAVLRSVSEESRKHCIGILKARLSRANELTVFRNTMRSNFLNVIQRTTC